ncbi:MAG: hypothetical protein Q9178_005758 [Gyalolechia marmorata]
MVSSSKSGSSSRNPMGPPQVPTFTSSKCAAQQDIERYKKRQRDYDDEIKVARSKVKVKTSFDAQYWSTHKNVSDLELARHEVVSKISKAEFEREGGKEDDWDSDQKAVMLRESKSSMEMKNKSIRAQMERLGSWGQDEGQAHREWSMQLVLTQPSEKGGLWLTKQHLGGHLRDTSDQSNFRAALIQLCNSEHPAVHNDRLWCPIVGAYLDEENVVAVQIFPYASGQNAMIELFGRPDGKDELMAPQNGLLIDRRAEQYIAHGWMTIVPDLSANATHEEVDAWSKADVKEYKIRVLDADDPKMKNVLPVGAPLHPTGNFRHWWELDGQKLEFKSDFRPRACYLYWSFAVALLRHSYQRRHSVHNPIEEQINKRFWGTGGPWIRRKYLRAFVEHLGHDINWENIMEAATEDEGEEADPAGLLEAEKQIAIVRDRMERGWPTEEEEAAAAAEEDGEEEGEDEEE